MSLFSRYSILNDDYHNLEINEEVDLFIIDPPYGKIINDKYDQLTEEETVNIYHDVLEWAAIHIKQGGSCYLFGGCGTYKNRAFFRVMSELEHKTKWRIHNNITWMKKRAIGTKYNYLYTREEIAFLIYDSKKPIYFDIPYLEEKRSNQWLKRLENNKYKPLSEYLRRSNVWCDVMEIMRNLIVKAQKPEKLYDIIINTSCPENGLVVDPMVGSGTTLMCCKRLNRKCKASEIDEEIYKKAYERWKGSNNE